MDYLETNIPSKRNTWVKWAIIILLLVVIIIAVVFAYRSARINVIESVPSVFSFDDIPLYSDSLVYKVNNGEPFFTSEELTTECFEEYTPLDYLGRCGTAVACLGKELMPTEERESIGMIKPSGWHTVRYDDVIEDKYLYNRCHLIAFMLAGENDNVRNLITGTRYFNMSGMLPYEIVVADYIEDTGNHVLYRATPFFVDTELVARGILMEAYSVEDRGRGVQICVFIYNIQPGIEIDYATGESWRE